MIDSSSRQAAINVLNSMKFDGEYCTEYGKGYNDGIDFALSLFVLLTERPERKIGEWINDKGLYRCSCCNQLWTEWWAISKPIERMKKDMPYCPKCGAKMDGERKTDE